MPVDLIIMPCLASSAQVSVIRTSPTTSYAMILITATRELVSVDFPIRIRNASGSRPTLINKFKSMKIRSTMRNKLLTSKDKF